MSVGAKLVGVGSAAPSTVLTNGDLAEFLETSDEWVSQRTGIRERKVLGSGERLSVLGAGAARSALEAASVDPGSVDLVVVATSSPDDMFGDATSVAHACGCENAAAFDLTAACSGFLYGVVTASQFLAAGTYDTVVVVGADALSRWVDWSDRNVCVLFGDGAGAVVMRKTQGENERTGVLGFALKSNGADQRHLTLPLDPEPTPLPVKRAVLGKGRYAPISMNGREVYKFATREVPKILQDALDDAHLSVDDIDWLLLHQANIRIMETVANRLGIPLDKIIANLDQHGNTSAASIPLALHHAVTSGQVQPGHVIATAGFGAGLSWGAAVIRWDGADSS